MSDPTPTEATPVHRFCWTELMTRDVEAAKDFYSRLFGWTFVASPFSSDYWVAHLGNEPVAGLFRMEGEAFDGIPPHWFSHIAVPDVDAAMDAVQAAGGTVLRPPFDVGPYRIAILQDASGAALGIVHVREAPAEPQG
ncbi:VOC family protein [Roseospira navarrensis]|uniref:VOC family protein n=1 Tax=Roseospira navarrensis TaxID=140058 RepID=A0A7X1ZDI5_9PROT|nr:VOC family protein [Roseospira navarrensis]MQX36569.1 VOC family protein [Roseospira navarrensis]